MTCNLEARKILSLSHFPHNFPLSFQRMSHVVFPILLELLKRISENWNWNFDLFSSVPFSPLNRFGMNAFYTLNLFNTTSAIKVRISLSANENQLSMRKVNDLRVENLLFLLILVLIFTHKNILGCGIGLPELTYLSV